MEEKESPSTSRIVDILQFIIMLAFPVIVGVSGYLLMQSIDSHTQIAVLTARLSIAENLLTTQQAKVLDLTTKTLEASSAAVRVDDRVSSLIALMNQRFSSVDAKLDALINANTVNNERNTGQPSRHLRQ